ncbi:hypothetical protein PIB30_055476 [Stylosanthes scabra]|uniref:Uncharacterized protein n=1 Tax=Stylosanthes scabra TaxID=79078 RepID=A0ABU6RJ09_9FABA|nr:hypothetical protein [Stylosanthes scabra]
MSDVVKLMYDTPWLCYSKVPSEVKDRWFNKWMESFFFAEPVDPLLVRKTFDYRMGRILQQMLRKIRLGVEENTGWMTPAFKREVRHNFATDEGFQRRSATNKVNRASAKGGALHCGGSATIPSTQERMGVYTEELDTRTQATQQSAHVGNDSNNPVLMDPNEVWRDVVGEPRKNHIYGDIVEELRTQIHGLTQELHQKVQQNEENEERVQQLLTQAELKMNATVEQARENLVREREELLREREEYQKMREEMAAYYANMQATASGVGSTTVTAPAAQPDGDGGQEEEEDDADDYQDP